MKFGSLVAGAAAAGLVMAPAAAQAGTKASTALVAPAESGVRTSTAVAKKNEWKSGTWIIAVLAAGAATYGLIKAFEDKSRG